MSEQRLIDANNLGAYKANPDVLERKDYAYGWNGALKAISEVAPTISPEALPIVQKLRAKIFMLQTNIESLEKQITQITAERNAAIEQLHGECSACKHYSQYHAKGKCKNCKWDNASLSRPVERWDDCWEWVGLQKVRNNE